MNTIIIKHDSQGEDEANIQVEGRDYIGYEFVVESKPEIVKQALKSFQK